MATPRPASLEQLTVEIYGAAESATKWPVVLEHVEASGDASLSPLTH